MAIKTKAKRELPQKHKIRGLRIPDGNPSKKQLIEIASAVKNDNSLDLQIRDGYLNVYYRGGSLLNIRGFRGNRLRFKIDEKYFVRKNGPDADKSWLPSGEENSHDTSLWLLVIEKLKNTMDEWYKENKDNFERHLQQQICSISARNPESPWIILDVEYAAWLYDKEWGRRLCKFDMIAVNRDSLKGSKPLTIYIVEFKQGNGALNGVAGVELHARDLLQFISSGDEVSRGREAFKHSVLNILKEKTELGLLSGVNAVPSSDEIELKALFLLHDSEVGADLQALTEQTLSGHGAVPLFWGVSQNPLVFFEYKQNGQ